MTNDDCTGVESGSVDLSRTAQTSKLTGAGSSRPHSTGVSWGTWEIRARAIRMGTDDNGSCSDRPSVSSGS